MEARFVSKGGNYSTGPFGFREGEVEHYATGREKIVTHHRDVQFSNRDVKDIDYETAVASSLQFTGLPFDKDTEQHVSIRQLLGVWDSRVARQTMPAEDVELCIRGLRASDRLGLDFVEVLVAALKPPWPAYDQMPRRNTADIQKIVDRAIENGCDMNDVIAYEAENKASAKLLDLLNEALDTDPAEAEVVITA